jgi:hypothetical protein
VCFARVNCIVGILFGHLACDAKTRGKGRVEVLKFRHLNNLVAFKKKKKTAFILLNNEAVMY